MTKYLDPGLARETLSWDDPKSNPLQDVKDAMLKMDKEAVLDAQGFISHRVFPAECCNKAIGRCISFDDDYDDTIELELFNNVQEFGGFGYRSPSDD